MTAALVENFERLAPRLETLRDAEPWPHFFDLRLSEWAMILRLAGPAMEPGRWLDIGSGNSASTALLGARGYRAVGIDLPARGWETHSYGTELHAQLWKGLGQPVVFAWASAADLPFRDESFDGVFSSYALQYVTDVGGGFREIARVLKPGRPAVLVLPSRVERLYAVSAMWQAIVGEAIARLRRRRTPSATPLSARGAAVTPNGVWGQLKRRFPQFPLPTADSPHRRWTEEVRAYKLGAWRRRAAAAGLRVELIATTSLTLRGISEWVVASWRLHRALRPAQLALQAGPLRPLAARIGESYLFILRKPVTA